jgi:hypothetical protein
MLQASVNSLKFRFENDKNKGSMKSCMHFCKYGDSMLILIYQSKEC